MSKESGRVQEGLPLYIHDWRAKTLERPRDRPRERPSYVTGYYTRYEDHLAIISILKKSISVSIIVKFILLTKVSTVATLSEVLELAPNVIRFYLA